ncbi:hypothetical protein LWI28_015024 [Acer negundo]|uniref:Uncharacterized protein n=1 Tax=Acer negundo TaxID=4023 RepID=A0AAD5JIZ9_ACENE|nr:hypothetical protein LWI28_015024 [Acer negundo]
MNEHTYVIQEILQKRPVSAINFTGSEVTILRIYIKFNQYESFKLLVKNDPDSMSVKETNLTGSKVTILHLSIKFNQYESFKLLMEDDPDLMSVKDDDHNNVLHMAVSQKNAEIC